MAMESIKDAETNDIPSQFPTLLSPLLRNLNADSVGFSKQCSECLALAELGFQNSRKVFKF